MEIHEINQVMVVAAAVGALFGLAALQLFVLAKRSDRMLGWITAASVLLLSAAVVTNYLVYMHGGAEVSNTFEGLRQANPVVGWALTIGQMLNLGGVVFAFAAIVTGIRKLRDAKPA